jgi:hypothetical protein
VVAVLLGAVAVAAPDLALLAGQGAVLGLLVAFAAAAWAWLTAGRTIFAARPAHTTVTRGRESASTQPPAPRSERSSRITSTAPAGAPIMEARP